MRILYVCSDFGVPVYGHKGASIHLRAMARALTDTGHTVQILSPALERDANFDFEVPAVTPISMAEHSTTLDVLRRADKRFGKLASGHVSRLGQEVRNLVYNDLLARAADSLRGFSADCVYERYALFADGGLALARALGVPHLLEVNAPLCLEQERVRGLHLGDLAREIETRVWCETDAFLGVSAELRGMALEAGAAAARVHVVPNGVDAARFQPQPGARDALRRELGLGSGPVLGFVGSLKSWHGTDVLLRAFARLAPRWPQARLLLVGEGPMAEALRSAAEDLEVASAVCFTGAVDHARVPDFLAAMDVTVAPYLPSEDFYFSPIKIYEYLAAGKPVVASHLGQIVALAEAGYVDTVPPGDADALAAALEAVLASPDRATERTARGREWTLRERTWTANARRLAELASAKSAART